MTNLKVTLSSPEVTLMADAGRITVSVTNTGLTADRVVLGVYPPLDGAPSGLPLGGTAPESQAPAATSPVSGASSAAEWTQVERPLRVIAAGATEQFVATFDGKAAAPGMHKVRFIAYSATRAPEEFSDQAGTVTITKQGALIEAAGPRRPWWLFVVAGLLVLVLTTVAFVLLRDDEKSPTSPAASTPTATAATRCKAGLVLRLARPTDLVCVSKTSAAQVLRDNNPDVQDARLANPRGGPYGPDTCAMGFVWREAFEGDTVCVDSARRTQTRQENADAASNAAP